MSKRIVTLGTWDGTPIQWIVLKENKLGSVVISKDCLFKMPFDANGNAKSDSDIRAYLNGEFFQQAFRAEEQKRIINTIIDGKKTDIFLLSREEAENWMTENERNTEKKQLFRSNFGNEEVVAEFDFASGSNFRGLLRALNNESYSFYIRPAFILDL